MCPSLCCIPVFHSKLNTRVVSKSPIFGEARTDREMSIFVHSHNCSIDIARGICLRDLYGVRFWVEREVIALSTNIEGAAPGGNLRMPAQRPAGSPYPEVVREKW